ncbi:MAG: PhoX family phosphatase [Pseudomonadota bacterium]
MISTKLGGDNAAIHDEKESVGSNRSGNTTFAEIAATRRDVMAGSLAAAVSGFLAPKAFAGYSEGTGIPEAKQVEGGLVNFEPVTIEQYTAQSEGGTVPVISSDYEFQVLIPWGTPIVPGVAEYTGDPNTRPTAAEQELMVGIGHDGMWFFPEAGATSDGMLCINHEFGTDSHLLGKDDPENLDDVRLSQAGHGVSVVRIAEDEQGSWDLVFDDRNRRITVNTPVAFDGPVAGSPFLVNPAGNPPLGTVNNCGSGFTPWGTYLTCEENFNGYFGIVDPNYQLTESQARYGFDADGFGYGWYNFDPRFDISNKDYVNESNRFGWIVEIDPQNPNQPPVKHTALGRFKHEAIAIQETPSGKVACYMGDDERFDYCYKFVSEFRWEDAIQAGISPLASGRLYVARFFVTGRGRWIELSRRNPTLREAFATDEELLVNARQAADLVGATPMDRPEWTSIGQNNTVYWTLTNNSNRTEKNAANREVPNNDGHIIRTREFGGDPESQDFSWDFYILASSTRESEGVFTDPDAAYVDPEGRLFIGTDGGQPDGLQDQLTVFDTTENLGPGQDPTPKRLFVGVNSDEITGWATTPDLRTAFTNMQHPGDGNPQNTNFPAMTDGVTIPRDCTIVLKKRDGGVVGS